MVDLALMQLLSESRFLARCHVVPKLWRIVQALRRES
jgi:hypothetical protein